MTKPQKLITFFLVAVALAGILQTSGVLRPWGIVPNFMLVTLAVAAFFIESFVPFLFLLIWSSIFLRFESGLSLTLVVFLLVGLLLFWVRGRILLPGISTTLLLIAGATLLLYLIFDPRLMYQFPEIVFWELLFNVILGVGLFWSVHRWNEKGA